MATYRFTEFDLFQALRPHFPSREYALLPQVGNSTGFRCNRHADALALSLWPSRGLRLHGFEIKSYRGDWLAELRNPEKAEEIARFCHHWWIVAGDGLVEKDEIPPGWGLMAYDQKAGELKKITVAPLRDKTDPLTIEFIAAMLRKAQEVVSPDANLKEEFNKGYKEGQKQEAAHADLELSRLRELEATVKAFTAASGVKIESWDNGKKIGDAVNSIVNGTTSRLGSRLRQIALRIVNEIPEEL